MISLSVSFFDQSMRTDLPASRREIAENCSSISASRTPLRRLLTATSNERDAMSSSLPSRTLRPVTASLVSLLTSAKFTRSPGFFIRFSLTWMIEASLVPISPEKRLSVRYSVKNLSSHCSTVRPDATCESIGKLLLAGASLRRRGDRASHDGQSVLSFEDVGYRPWAGPH